MNTDSLLSLLSLLSLSSLFSKHTSPGIPGLVWFMDHVKASSDGLPGVPRETHQPSTWLEAHLREDPIELVHVVELDDHPSLAGLFPLLLDVNSSSKVL